jgi:hypothetical protein
MAANLQVLAATFTDDARVTMGPFLMRFPMNFPVGYSTRGAILRWLRVGIDDGLKMPGLSVIDAKGVPRAHHGWRDAIFQPPDEKSKMAAAIRKVAGKRGG